METKASAEWSYIILCGLSLSLSFSSLANWITLERAPPLIFLLLACGPCLSSLYVTQGCVDTEKGVVGELVS